LKITEIEPLVIGPEEGAEYNHAIIVVLVRTDEGVTGIGEASLAGRTEGVMGVLAHFRELLVGRDPTAIEHLWSEMVRGAFWSTGQVMMSAVAGIDLALWDIKGKRLGVPVYELLGGPTRHKVRVYRHLAGDTIESVVEDAHRWVERGFSVLRFAPLKSVDAASLAAWDPQVAIVSTIKLADALRRTFGDDVELICDAHTMFSPAETVTLGRGLEPYRLFFYEDPIRPLNPHSLRLVREKVHLPLATGEQFAHKWEFQTVIEEELIDYLRIDLVHAGGITEAKKILAAAEMHGQRSALHHASSPINGVACLHVDQAVPNFGIQEWTEADALYELFPNAPRAKDGYVSAPTAPGLGLEFNEEAARKQPARDRELSHRYWPDGSVGDF
jgi:L-alanine-DL-glutamate epimerase-like enolase superfamily enzyme